MVAVNADNHFNGQKQGFAKATSFGFAAAFHLSMLFQPQIGALSPVLCAACFLLFCLCNPAEFYRSITGNPLILTLPLFALVSFVWSEARSATLYYAIQYLITVLAGLVVGGTRNGRSVLNGMFAAWAIYGISTVAFGHSVGWGNQGGTAFSGLTGSKNYAGDTAALGAIFSSYFILSSVQMRSPMRIATGCVALLFQLYIISIARSSGSIIGVAQSVLIFAVFLSARRMPLPSRMLLSLCALILAIVAITTYPLWGPATVGAILDAFGKDHTLTGRLYLWYRADQLIAEHAVLGMGYFAFWQQGNIDAEGLWRYAGIAGRMGFNFHNTPTEILVNLGWTGMVIFAAVFFTYGTRLLWATLSKMDLMRITWVVIICYEMGRMSYESVGLGPFSYATVLLIAALAAGSRHAEEDRPSSMARKGSALRRKVA